MSNISQFFYRDSYFTKKHDDKNPNPNLINLANNKKQFHKKINENNSDNLSGRASNEKSDSIEYDLNYQEIELYHAKVETIIPIDDKLN